ncbi:helix-turn-helix transcriptional regulator [Alsobacter sp. R-9]
MTLDLYLTLHGMNATQFAEAIGVTPSTITRILRGERRPNLETLRKIARATDGQVKAEDFFLASTREVAA